MGPLCGGKQNHKGWTRNNNRHDVRYPQLLSTAWLDYSDQAGGVSVEQRGEQFDICDFGVEHLIEKDRGDPEKISAPFRSPCSRRPISKAEKLGKARNL